jgi:hypothetical protein
MQGECGEVAKMVGWWMFSYVNGGAVDHPKGKWENQGEPSQFQRWLYCSEAEALRFFA